MTNASKILISPSIIAADLSSMSAVVKGMDREIVDMLHMDVMDGNFVPNLTFGPGYIKNLKSNTDIPLDVHLMIERPENSIDQYIDIVPWCITFHYEATRFPARILSRVREAGIKSGVAINPATPVEAVYDLLPYMDMVLIMSVDPGFYGQKFMEQSIHRIERLSDFVTKNRFNILIEVDGGIGRENISRIVKAGAGMIVVGNSAFSGGDVNKNVSELRKSI